VDAAQFTRPYRRAVSVAVVEGEPIKYSCLPAGLRHYICHGPSTFIHRAGHIAAAVWRRAIIHSKNTCDISTVETYYLNFIASQLYTQKWL